MNTTITSLRTRGIGVVCGGMLLALAGCASTANRDYYGSRVPQSGRYACQRCGVVDDMQRVYTEGNGNAAVIGTVIGAVVGAAAGNQVGKGDGRKAATVGGAVAGGAIGHEIGQHQGGERSAWRIRVRLDDGRYATVTQRERPDVRIGDYVEVQGDRVYRR